MYSSHPGSQIAGLEIDSTYCSSKKKKYLPQMLWRGSKSWQPRLLHIKMKEHQLNTLDFWEWDRPSAYSNLVRYIRSEN